MNLGTEFFAVLAALSTVLGGFFGYLSNRRTQTVISLANARPEKRDLKAETRYYEIESMLQSEEKRRIRLKAASRILVFGQFVAGGILASSFVLQHLSEPVLGVLGLSVLAASLINQHYRFDILYKASSGKARKLSTLRRRIEDEIFRLETFNPNDAIVVETRERATKALEEIEADESRILEKEHEGS